jgi:general secretion pathway protein C
MSSRWTGFFVWALVAATAAFWGLRIFAAARALPVEARVPPRPVAVNSPMTHVFGALPEPEAASAPPPESERFALQGVIAEGDHGIVVLSIDNQPPKAWRVGTTVEGDTTLLSVSRRAANFGPQGGPSTFTLELPPPAAPATGTLPSATSPAAYPPPATAAQPAMVVRPGGGPATPQGAMPYGANPAAHLPGNMVRGPNGVPIMPPRPLPQAQPQQQPQGQPPGANASDEE